MLGKQTYNQIYKIQYFNQRKSASPSFMIITPNGIQIFEFIQIKNQEFLQKWIKVTPEKSGKYQFDVLYTGTCKNQSIWKQNTYCSLTKRVQLNITDNLGQTLNQWWIWLCISFAISIVLLLIFCFVFKYFRNKNSQYQSFIQIRNRNSSSYLQMPNVSNATQ